MVSACLYRLEYPTDSKPYAQVPSKNSKNTPVYICERDEGFMFEKLLQKLKFGSGKANKSDNVNAFKESEKKQNTGTKIDVKDESAKTEQK